MYKSKNIKEEQENISQQVRNWNGSKFVFDNIQQRLATLRNHYEQEENFKKFGEKKKNLKKS